MQKKWFWLAVFASVATMPAMSTPSNSQRAMLERLVQCDSTAIEVVDFNNLLDSKKIVLPRDDKNAGWGGVAWKVDPPITIGTVKSNVVVMADRRSFYLFIESPNPRTDSGQVVQTLKLHDGTPNDQYFDYRREDGERTVRVVSTENAAANYNVGCFYDQESVRRVQHRK